MAPAPLQVRQHASRQLATAVGKILGAVEEGQRELSRTVLEPADDPAHTRITDLHVWRVGKRGYSLAVILVTHDNRLTPHAVRQRLAVHEEIVHSTIEIHLCEGDHV